jgi:hypothetical protein
MAEVQTVSADQKTGHRGWVSISEGKVLITSIWFSDVTAIDKGAGGLTEILMRSGVHFATAASVAEVQSAIGIATTLWETTATRWKNPA